MKDQNGSLLLYDRWISVPAPRPLPPCAAAVTNPHEKKKIIHFLYDRKVNMKTRMENWVSLYFLFSLLLYCRSIFDLQYFGV